MSADDRRYGLIFDVDGVIADTESVNAQASIRVFADLFGVEGVKRGDFEAGLGRGAEEYVRAAARVHGLDLSADQVRKATEARQESFLALLDENPLAPFPGVRELMDAAISRKDFGVAIATSSSREKSRAVLESAGIPYRNTVYVTGSDISRKKPAPDLFVRAAGELSLPPGRCLVVEDAPDGVEAALLAGCRCIAVTNTVSADKLARADLVVSSLDRIGIDDVIRRIDRD